MEDSGAVFPTKKAVFFSDRAGTTLRTMAALVLY